MNDFSKILQVFITVIILCSFVSCTENFSSNPFGGTENENFLSDGWLIPKSEVVDGGPGKDGIPSIENPNFTNVEVIDFIPDERMIIGVQIGDVIRAYPHQILDWHEIVNDQIGDKYFQSFTAHLPEQVWHGIERSPVKLTSLEFPDFYFAII